MIKILLVVGFIGIGLVGGHNAWPHWRPPNPSDGFPFGPFMQNLLFITFAFSGWNAAVYAASEFRNPGRDVSRAIILGCALVGVLYLVVNWVFVANLTPEQCAIVTSDETGRITLGHLIMKNLIGETGAACMSILVIVAFISAMSAMTFLGPRVYAEMAKDGFLPRALQAKQGKAPIGAVILQGAIALLLVFAYQLGEVLSNVGAILTLFSALTVLGLFWMYFKHKNPLPVRPGTWIAGSFYLVLSLIVLYFGFKQSPTLNLWVGTCILASIIGYFLTRQKAKSRSRRVPVTDETSR
ncbi:MAG: APC family permease [Acidobacteriota bacterium]